MEFILYIFRVFAQTTVKIVHIKTSKEEEITKSGRNNGHTMEGSHNVQNTWGGSNNGHSTTEGRNNVQNTGVGSNTGHGTTEGRNNVKNTGGGSNNGHGTTEESNNVQNTGDGSNIHGNDQGKESGRNNVQNNGLRRNIGGGSQGPKQNGAFKEDPTNKNNEVITPEPYRKTVQEVGNNKQKMPRRYG